MRYKSNKGTNTSKSIPHAGDLIPHVAQGVLKKLRLLNYNSSGKNKNYIDGDGVAEGTTGGGIKASLARNTD